MKRSHCNDSSIYRLKDFVLFVASRFSLRKGKDSIIVSVDRYRWRNKSWNRGALDAVKSFLSRLQVFEDIVANAQDFPHAKI